MNDIKEKLKNIDSRQLINTSLGFLKKHNFTALMVLAGILVGYSLLSVNTLNNNLSSPASLDDDTLVIKPKSLISFSEEIISKLKELETDSDVSISSNIASYRRSAFSDIVEESKWVIDAARLLKSFKSENGSYPNDSNIVSALSSQDPKFVVLDPNNITINGNGGVYTYKSELCGVDEKNENECEGFLLSSSLGGNVYQLGETDITKHDWIDSTGQSLDLFYSYEERGFYPLESKFVEQMTQFYQDVYEDSFVSNDPNEILVNTDGSNYVYRGIDCDTQGCQSFVLRTVFKDDASYFRQNK